jgi:hypothetical protein
MGPLFGAEPQGIWGGGGVWQGEDFPLSDCGEALIFFAPSRCGLRPALMAEAAPRQDMVGIGDKLLPLTARAGRGLQDRIAATSSITLTCERKCPHVTRGSGFDWRVKERFTPRVVTCSCRCSDLPSQLNLSAGSNTWMR